MELHLRCASVRVEPSDASGFLVTLEACDADAVVHEVLMGLDEKRLRDLLGDEQVDDLARRGHAAIQRALDAVAPPPERAGEDQ